MEQTTNAELLAQIYLAHSEHPLVMELADRLEAAEDALAQFHDTDDTQ